MGKILTVCLNPSIQKTLVFRDLTKGFVNRSKDHYTSISGKGVNVTRILRELGENPIHLTHLGLKNRKWFLKHAKNLEINLIGIKAPGNIRTCYTLLEDSGETTELIEEAEVISEKTHLGIIKTYNKLVKKVDLVCISGSKSPGYRDDIIPNLVRIAKDYGKTVIMDITGRDLQSSLVYKPDYIKINLEEFVTTFGSDFSRVSQNLLDNGINLIVTNGNGNTLFRDNDVEALPSNDIIKPLNTTGCGDAFLAGFVHSISKGKDLKDAVKAGIHCGGLSATSPIPGTLDKGRTT